MDEQLREAAFIFLRDWILHRRQLLIIFALFGAFQIYFVTRASSSPAWTVFATLYASFLSMSIFVREDMFRATAWTCPPLLRASVYNTWAPRNCWGVLPYRGAAPGQNTDRSNRGWL